MKESDYLNPNDIKSQCDQAIHKLENDNETLDIVSTIKCIPEECQSNFFLPKRSVHYSM